MKNLILTLALAICASAVFGQVDAIDKYFSKYQEDESFTVVYVSAKMFQMVTKVLDENENQDIKDLISGIKRLKVLKTEVDPLTRYKEAIATINTSEYEVLMTVKDEGQNVRLLTKDNGDIINELLLLVGGNEEFVLLSFVGDLDLKKIAKLAKNLDIEGAKHLEKLEEHEEK